MVELAKGQIARVRVSDAPKRIAVCTWIESRAEVSASDAFGSRRGLGFGGYWQGNGQHSVMKGEPPSQLRPPDAHLWPQRFWLLWVHQIFAQLPNKGDDREVWQVSCGLSVRRCAGRAVMIDRRVGSQEMFGADFVDGGGGQLIY